MSGLLSRITLIPLLLYPASLFAGETTAPVGHAEYILQKVAEADAVCDKVPLTATVEEVPLPGKNGLQTKRIVERPVALCAYSEKTKTWKVIELRLQYPIPQGYITCVKSSPTIEDRTKCILPYRVITPGFQVEHLRGYGITRLTFNVYVDEVIAVPNGDESRTLHVKGEKLVVYRTRHLWFDDDATSSGDADRIAATAVAVNYTPYHPDFSDDDLVDAGAQFLFDKVRGAQHELGTDLSDRATVHSRAFPERALADVVPWETPMALAVIEQMDDKTFQEDGRRATDAVLIEYAIDRENAFRYSQSGANAIGPLQFTEAGGNGTYSAMVRGYPEANLDPVFQSGARNLGNVLKAAIALIDHELANFSEVHAVFLRNPRVGGAFPVAAYNGGPASARALYAWLKRHGVNIERKELDLPSSIAVKRVEKCPCKTVRPSKGKKKRTVDHIVVPVQNSETPGYVVKYFYLLNYLADMQLE